MSEINKKNDLGHIKTKQLYFIIKILIIAIFNYYFSYLSLGFFYLSKIMARPLPDF